MFEGGRPPGNGPAPARAARRWRMLGATSRVAIGRYAVMGIVPGGAVLITAVATQDLGAPYDRAETTRVILQADSGLAEGHVARVMQEPRPEFLTPPTFARTTAEQPRRLVAAPTHPLAFMSAPSSAPEREAAFAAVELSIPPFRPTFLPDPEANAAGEHAGHAEPGQGRASPVAPVEPGLESATGPVAAQLSTEVAPVLPNLGIAGVPSAPDAAGSMAEPQLAAVSAKDPSQDPKLVVESNLPMMIAGKVAGQLKFLQTLDGLNVRLGSLVDLLKDHMAAEGLARFEGTPALDAHLSLAELRKAGIPIVYDPIGDVFELRDAAPVTAPGPAATLAASASTAQDLGAPYDRAETTRVILQADSGLAEGHVARVMQEPRPEFLTPPTFARTTAEQPRRLVAAPTHPLAFMSAPSSAPEREAAFAAVELSIPPFRPTFLPDPEANAAGEHAGHAEPGQGRASPVAPVEPGLESATGPVAAQLSTEVAPVLPNLGIAGVPSAPDAAGSMAEPQLAAVSAKDPSQDPKLVVESNLPMMIAGKVAGQLKFLQTLDGLNVRLGSLVDLLKDHMAAEGLARFEGTPALDAHLSLAELRKAGIPIVYDPIGDVFELRDAAPVTAPGPAATLAASASTAQDLGAPTVLPREQELQLPVLVDGNYRGDLNIIVGADNQLRVRLDSVMIAVERLLRPEVAERLKSVPTVDGLVRASALAPDIRLRLDEAAIEVQADIPPSSRPEGLVSLAEDRFANIEYIEAEPFAMAVAIDFGGAYSFRQPRGFQGEAGRIASWINLGGADGAFLDAEAFYDSEGEVKFRRGDIRLSKDDPGNAIRYSIGDLLYLTQGFQGAPRIGGIGAQRLYEELDPLRIIRPQGRTSFTLDRAATVEVIVNGIPFRTIRFDPGTYSINDIPYAEGGNNVELLIRDDSGVERRLEFSGYSSANLLAEGLSEFGIVTGFASDFTPSGISYDTGEPLASALYRVGVSSNLTLGANAQASRDLVQIGGELIFAGPDLLVSARAAFSDLDNRGSGYSWEVNTQYRPLGDGGVSGFFLEGNARGTSRDFASLGIINPRNDFKLETAVRGGFAIDRDSNVSLGYTRQFARDPATDISRYSLTASRRFGNLAAFVTYDRREVQGQEPEDRFLVTVSLPLGNRSTYARATYDSDRQALRAEVQRLPRGAVGDLSGTVAVETNENGQELLGQLRYRDNRFIVGLDNAVIHNDAQSTISAAVTRYSVRSGFGVAGGKLLVSPTLGEGSFVAVAKGRGITEGKVVLNDSPIGPQAVSDGLGPAVFGGIRGYVPIRITADVITDQAGFESASETVNILPGARTGYVTTVGEEATAIVVATIRKPDGSPASLLAGTVSPVDESRPPVQTFTNRSGRLVAESLVPGDYRLTIPGTGTAIFAIAEDQLGIVQLGEISLRASDSIGAEK